ncbi:MAG: HEAT repeat domain-containing protein [Planctomycetota bacterium]|nr:HEAT repeat domain-containing protein [Planctomycetota bacterium]
MRMRLVVLFPLLVAGFVLPLLALETGPAHGKDDDLTPYELRRKEGKCLCETGFASWQYLRSPMRPPADPPVCGLILAGGDCSSKDRPKGTGADCWGSQRKECFWKRHAYSYGMHCSECWKDTECATCDALIGKPDEKVQALLDKQMGVEQDPKDKGEMVIAISPRFYVVTDIHNRLKVLTEGGAPRVASAHEVAHLFLERCERAYADFEHWFGGDMRQGGPMGVYLMSKHSRAESYAQKYLGSANTDMLYGGGTTRIGGGFAFNGFVGSLQEQRSDDNLHAYCRHMIGHILFSTWVKVDGKEQYCPKWAFIGSAHFLEKMLEPHKDYATFCSNETAAPTGSPKDWDKKARGLAGRRLDPIETFFSRNSLGAFEYLDHIRAWSLMDLCMREDNARWLKVLKHLRWGDEEGVAFKEGMALSPDQFNDRWVDRLTGKRDTMGETKKDERTDPDEPGRKERDAIRTTDDPEILAGRIRGVAKVEDVKLAEVIVGRMGHPSDLVRETIQLIMETVEDPTVLAWLTDTALVDSDKDVRAGVARVFAVLKHAPARPALEAMLQDSYWLARANAAYALSAIADPASLEPVAAALSERQDKAWIALADAAASFSTRHEQATLLTMPRIDHPAWQVRVTACRALAKYGTASCMDVLIKQFEKERGRLEVELRAALKAVSGDDLGPNASTWAKWWESQKEQHGGFDPNPPPKSDDEGRYAKPDPTHPDDPHYYGRRIFSKSVGFVFDTSGSMEKNIIIPKGASTMLGDIPTSGTRMDVAKQVLADAIKKLKPQTQFNLVFFSTEVRPWKKTLIPASSGNTSSAAGAVMAAPAAGETNIHGALKAALGLHEQPTLTARLQDIPDTVYFLTDGSPTRGEITATPELLGWFQDLNRFAKVKLHVVAFGNLGVDIEFLRRLAAAGDGDFIHVPEE